MKILPMRILICLFLFIGIFCCNENSEKESRTFNDVEVEDIYNDTTLSIRAIELLNDKSLAFAANNGVFGLYKPKTNSWMTSVQQQDTLDLQFRAVAHTASDFFMLTVGNPALLYKTGDDGLMELVYREDHEKVFYDAMQFWNDDEGIAIGDPTEDCMSIIITRDGGNTWKKVPCDKLPKVKDGEAAFAASNTNVDVVGTNTWVATGGKTSRILYSPDKGESWKIFETPMMNGEAMTGIYSVDFYDGQNGIAIGGNYSKPDISKSNKMITSDGGKSWKIIADGKEPGYRSCVQYVPNSEANAMVAIGFKGIDYSNDRGETWTHLSDESFYTIRFLNDSVAYAAGRDRISRLVFK